ncbi:MAG: DUF262 domain-containing protein [Rhodobacteraceae bacterium]|nr:DUF262 domain-containing protein [Paracoccaceae bacterium]MCY4137559.1 DUF262 domain-containing protein [Paracoccaceae bacterium]
MSRIRGEDRSVKSLLGQKFQIDYYQRDYKWESKQVRELIEDLTGRFLLDYQCTHERRAVARYGQYFLSRMSSPTQTNSRPIETASVGLFCYRDRTMPATAT